MNPPAATKRPFGLSAVLTLCLLFGVWGANDGCSTLGMYAGGLSEPPMEMLAIADEGQRQLVNQAYEHLVEQTEAARDRAEPLGAAAVVLGLAMMFITLRAFVRSQTARALLWQLQLAQTALVLATHLLLPNVQHAWIDLFAATQRAHAAEVAKSEEDLASLDRLPPLLHRVPRASAVFRVVLGLGIVLMLNRRSTREYFGAAHGEPRPS